MYGTKNECYFCVYKFGKNLKNVDKSKGSFHYTDNYMRAFRPKISHKIFSQNCKHLKNTMILKNIMNVTIMHSTGLVIAKNAKKLSF